MVYDTEQRYAITSYGQTIAGHPRGVTSLSASVVLIRVIDSCYAGRSWTFADLRGYVGGWDLPEVERVFDVLVELGAVAPVHLA
jgi:hypothetical protein